MPPADNPPMHTARVVVEEDLSLGQPSYGDKTFPLVLRAAVGDSELAAVVEWVRRHRDELDRRATRHGAILFRGFPLATTDDFDAFIRAFDYPNFRYEESLSNAVRVVRTDRVFSANEAPPEVTIFLHHEMAQTPIYPSRLFFFCERAAETGGATPICRSDILYERLRQQEPAFIAACEAKGVRYTNVMPPANDPASGMGRSWQSTLRAETVEQAEARLRTLDYKWQWLDDGCLRATTPVLPAVREVGRGRKSFFNQLIAAFKGWKDSRNDPSQAIKFGDDTPLDSRAVYAAADLAEELTYDVPWQAGDVVLVDNFIAMHGRRSFTGPRKIWASLVAAE
jgi:alpha-ketoglutarate-dependent taurine dioxygenase